MQKSPAPWRPCFSTNQLGLKESDRRSPKVHFYKLFENRPYTFRGRDFISFHYSHIRENSAAPWRPCFSTNQNGLKESDRRLSKEHFFKIIRKSANQFWRIIIWFRCHGNQNSAWITNIWRNSDEVNERMLSVKFHPIWPTRYWGENVDGRQMPDKRRLWLPDFPTLQLFDPWLLRLFDPWFNYRCI